MRRSEMRRARRGEMRFVLFLATFVVLVAGIQILMRFERPRRFLNETIDLEGLPLSQTIQGLSQEVRLWLDWPPPDEFPDSSWATLYLRFLGNFPSEAWVVVNGRATKRLGNEGGAVTVKDGDSLEVYCGDGEISVVVSAASRKLASPAIGKWARGSVRVNMGTVRLQ